MRTEKQFLVDEVGTYLDKSDYALLAEYTRLTVAETRELRRRLAQHKAEFHVVKNTILNKAAGLREVPDMTGLLGGQLGIIVGGDAISTIVKEAEKFFKEKDKGSIKGAILSKKLYPAGPHRRPAQPAHAGNGARAVPGPAQHAGQQLVRLLSAPRAATAQRARRQGPQGEWRRGGGLVRRTRTQVSQRTINHSEVPH
jgi:large subunit ribosomal protein L10